MSESFFDDMSEQSLVKATIVSKYFSTWARIMIRTAKKNEERYGKEQGRIAYLDLFAGPGRYKQGTKSTPLMILEKAINDEEIRQRLVTLFNDKDEANVQSLEREIAELPNVDKLRYKPQVMNQEIGTEIVKMFEEMDLIPTLFFVDPFGYKGLSLQLINSVLKDWGCDGIFFFNYNRVSMGLPNPAVQEHMNALFGREKADQLRIELDGISDPQEKELVIIETLAQSLKEMGGEYVLPFRFRDAKGTRTSHHLIFVSKHFRGYEKMKEIMAVESSSSLQGVPSFEYSLATKRQPLLFSLARPLDELGDSILAEFAGQTLTMQQVYENHNVGTQFIKKNYKNILWQLECEGRITATKHRPNTFGDKVKVTFPRKR